MAYDCQEESSFAADTAKTACNYSPVAWIGPPVPVYGDSPRKRGQGPMVLGERREKEQGGKVSTNHRDLCPLSIL